MRRRRSRLLNAELGRDVAGSYTPALAQLSNKLDGEDGLRAQVEDLASKASPAVVTTCSSLSSVSAKSIDVRKPSAVIGQTTIGAIESGLFYGYLGMVEAIIKRMTEALGGKGGGGRPDMAQAGGPDGSKANAALDAIVAAIGA